MSLVEIDCSVIAETEMAIKITDGSVECWIPKAAVKDQTGDDWDEVTSIFINEHLATEKGLI